MMKADIKQIVNIGIADSEYIINGMRYIVSSQCAALDIKKVGTTITEKFEKYIGSDLTHLTINNDTNTIDTEYVCSTAGKED